MSHRKVNPAKRKDTRRSFIQKTAAAAAGIVMGGRAASSPLFGEPPRAVLLADDSHPSIRQGPVAWALEQLRRAFDSRGIVADLRWGVPEQWPGGEVILVAHRSAGLAGALAESRGIPLPEAPESFALVRGQTAGRSALLAAGADERGLTYALLELSDRATYDPDVLLSLKEIDRVVKSPANPVRSVTRLFVSEVEDKAWFYDKSFWERYLSTIVSQQFNRFSLTLGLGYDLPRHVLDAYFIFAYPFLVSVPGYDVGVRGLPKEERERNLETLQWIGRQATARGLDFQLGLWSHTYQWIDSPNANYVIDGLSPENHASYCREALRTLLEACPEIGGITFRAHSESGIPDGSYEFWGTVFEGVVRSGREVKIDLHSKGIDYRLIDIALRTGMPVFVSPKLTAEHMGLPAHQIAIRERERTRPSSTPQERSFTRYGYADYLREDRKHGVYFRIWPCKQKVLLWGDPALASGYGRHAGFCGSLGLELCEPLSFKGRQGSGHSWGRSPYADATLRPSEGDHEKYLYTYRLWGRHLYDPDAPPDARRRYLRHEFGEAAPAVETALGHAGRVLPLVTSSHLPSASAMTYWPELYTNMPIVDAGMPHPYGDTPEPRVFGTVSPLDPGLFSSIDEFVRDGLQGKPSGKYSPVDVARRLEVLAETSETHLAEAQAKVRDVNHPSFRRLAVDTRAQAGLGRFFAAKMRAAVAFELYQQTGKARYLEEALAHYRNAREAWADVARRTRGIYIDDLNFGYPRHRRGHWADRLQAIDEDLAVMEKLRKQEPARGYRPDPQGSPAAQADLPWMKPRPHRPQCRHQPPGSFQPGRKLDLELAVIDSRKDELRRVVLHYRHVNQGEEYRVQPASGGEEGLYSGNIPGEYTDSPYPLLYYFELFDDRGHAWLYPGLEEDLSNQPYFVVRSA